MYWEESLLIKDMRLTYYIQSSSLKMTVSRIVNDKHHYPYIDMIIQCIRMYGYRNGVGYAKETPHVKL